MKPCALVPAALALALAAGPAWAGKLTTPPVFGRPDAMCLVTYSGTGTNVPITVTRYYYGNDAKQSLSFTFKMGPSNRIVRFNPVDCITPGGANACELVACVATLSVPAGDVALSLQNSDPEGNGYLIVEGK